VGALISLLVILVLGSYVRLTGLGTADLSHDELIHYFTAQAIERGAGPELPSGEPYLRGVDITRLAGVGARLVNDTELGVRLPSALFGILNLVLLGAIAWSLGGPWAAVVATLLMAIYPEAVGQSRSVRFYTYQLNFGLVALFATWQLVRGAGAPELATSREIRRRWVWGVVAGIAFLLAARVQVTTLSVVAGAGLAVLMAAAADVWRHGREAWRASAALQLVAVGSCLMVAALLIEPSLIEELVARSQHVPLWARSGGGGPLSYYRMISESFPLLIALAPPIFIAVAFRDLRLAVFLACWFGVPFVLHSLFLPWKGERFVFVAMPGLFLAASIAAVVAVDALRAALLRRLPRSIGPVAAGVAIGAATMFLLASTPALHRTRKVPSGSADPMLRRELWQSTAALLKEIPDIDSLPIGSSTPLAALHYFGRADFAVRRDALVRPIGRLQLTSIGSLADLAFGEFPQGTPDYYTGLPVLTTPEAIAGWFRDRREVLLVIDSTRWVFGDIEPSLKSTLVEQAPELCRGRCGSLLAFRWTVRAEKPGHSQ
jgi:hypothetical protein